MEKINKSWIYFKNENEKEKVEVDLPHSINTFPLHYSDKSLYERVSIYKKTITLTKEDLEGRVFIHFDGVGHLSTLFLNEKEIYTHLNGYTGFSVELKDALEGENEIKVRVDSTENPSIPPFGYVIDYLTYGGIYRDVFLDKRKGKSIITNTFVYTPTLTSCVIEYEKDGECEIKSEILDNSGNTIAYLVSKENKVTFSSLSPTPWTIKNPVLYTLRSTTIIDGKDADTSEVEFGFRTVKIDKDGFYLNGEKIFLRGLNRHQSWPEVGYATTERMQREDARILKYELGLNAVRTSHYIQSRYFLSECDKIGLLVFTEIPGWQHIGDDEWKKVAIKNTEEMIKEDRNHPSIFLWGVRINESMDDDDFYRETNKVAHTLDPTRPTSGVRYIEKSNLLEDVYSYNDFSHNGNNSGVKKKKKVVKDMNSPLLISECNGHMFPTKSFDNEIRRTEHALRHARVLNDAMSDGEHIGVFEWCFTDYATHEDFGSGDRVCYHGVCDNFRNKKSAGYFYESQSDDHSVLYSTSTLDIGEYDGGKLSSFYVFTNADKVKLYKGGKYVNTFYPSSEFSHLPHPPILIDDFIGSLLESEEGFSKKKAEGIRDCLNAAKKYGINSLPLRYMLKLLFIMIKYHLKYEDGVKLYGKYVGGWGDDREKWRLDGIKGEEVVKSITLFPSSKLHLEVDKKEITLIEDETYDEELIRLRVFDEYNNLTPYAQLPIKIDIKAPVTLCGNDTLTLEGGMSGVIIKTIGKRGNGVIKFSNPQTGDIKVKINVRGKMNETEMEN